MWTRIREMVRKEFLVAFREPKMRVLLFAPPLIQLLIFGYAVNLDIEQSRIAWMDHDNTPQSRALQALLEGSPYFRLTAFPPNPERLDRLLDQGDVRAAVVVLPGFARDLKKGRAGQVQIVIDGSDSNTASILSSYLQRAIARFPGGLAVQPVEVRSRIWFNPDLRSQDYFVPGVIVNIVALVTIMLTSMAVVREREIGTLEQLLVSPIRPLELMLGKTVPFALVGVAEMAMITVAALVVFGIPLRGSPFILLAATLLFVLTTLAVGLLISTLSNTQQQAMMGSFFFFVPAFLLSGFAFPVTNMPPAIQLATYLNPIRYFMEIVRSLFLKGTGLEILWPHLAALAGIGIFTVLASARRFRKRLD